MQLQEGALLLGGKYQIEKVLGQGGFGITYLAKQKITIKGDLGEIESVINVAIKEFFMKDLCNRDTDSSAISIPSVGSQDFVKRFRDKFMKEAENISRLKHSNIVKVLEIFEENGTAYYVMEFVKGGSLSGYVDKNGALSESTAVYFTRQIAQALDYIHQQRINHLDVKPANILMRDDNSIVLIDFGLAKRYDNSGEQTSSTPVGISAGYAPLEQYQTGGVTSFSPTTDIYALGATLFKMVTGNNPPDASYVNNEGLPEIEGVSQELVNVINMAMQPRYKSRPQSIAEFVALLPTDSMAGDGDETVIMTPTAASTPKPTNAYQPQVVVTSSQESDEGEQRKKPKMGVIVAAAFAAILVLFAGYMLAMNYQVKAELKAQQAEQARIEAQAEAQRLEAEQAARDKAAVNKKAEAEKRAAAERRRQEELRKKAAEQSSEAATTTTTPTTTPAAVQTPTAVTTTPTTVTPVSEPKTQSASQADKAVYESARGAGGARPSSGSGQGGRPQGGSQGRNSSSNSGNSQARSSSNSYNNSSANSSSRNSSSSSARPSRSEGTSSSSTRSINRADSTSRRGR